MMIWLTFCKPVWAKAGSNPVTQINTRSIRTHRIAAFCTMQPPRRFNCEKAGHITRQYAKIPDSHCKIRMNSGYRVSGMKLTTPLMPRCDLTAGRIFVM